MAKKTRPRSQRREAARAVTKLQAAREKLFLLGAGGAAERPVFVASAAVIETQAESTPCPSCDGRHEVVEHVAASVSGVRLREVRLRCRQCGTRRSLWFRIGVLGPN